MDNKMEFMSDDGKEIGIVIRSIKKDRTFILEYLAKHPEVTHMLYHGRRYTGSDIYGRF